MTRSCARHVLVLTLALGAGCESNQRGAAATAASTSPGRPLWGAVAGSPSASTVGSSAAPRGVPIATTTADAPSLGGCSKAGAFSQGRYSPTASTLADGRVLVAGGRLHDGEDLLRSVELFDPKDASFTHAPALHVARALHSALRLRDGRVLIAGGYTELAQYGTTGPVKPEPPVELYSPTQRRWTSVGHYGYYGNAVGVSLTQMRDGRVLLAGGDALNFGRVSPDAAAFDPVRNALSPLPPMPGGRASHFAREREDGAIVLWGGHDYPNGVIPGPAPTIELLPKAAAWQSGSSSEPVWWRVLPQHAIALWSVVSETLQASAPMFLSAHEVQCFDAAAGAWRTGATLATDRTAAAATLLPDGRLFVVGGAGESTPEATAELCTLAPFCQR
jgi:hypothetical protein